MPELRSRRGRDGVRRLGRPSAGLLAAALPVLLLVVACGSAEVAPSTGGPSCVPATGPAATSAASWPAAGGGGGAPGASPRSACDLLTDGDIRTVTGLGVAMKAGKFMSGVSPNGCDWTLDDASASEVQLAYVDTGGRQFFDTYYAPYNSPLPGVGDAAIRTDTGGVMAVTGDAAIFTDYIEFPATHKDYPLALLKAALAHLP